jgi:ATP-dependent 26S proteasome regulatory subunit
VRYLLSRLTELTVVILSGKALGMVGEACSVARSLQPALVVVEDVDLIAQDRGPHPGPHPLLLQLLNEIDGLGEDIDVTFVLTTNRADLLEPALAARPGRVDQAVYLPLPDAAARRRLLDLYTGSLRLDSVDLDRVVAATEGVTAAFLKELLRKAALAATTAPANADGSGPLPVTGADVDTALAALQDGTNQLTRLLLGARAHDEADPVTGWLAESQGRGDSDADPGWVAYSPLQ